MGTVLSNRLKDERKRTMWQSGLLRDGDPNNRKYWMEERIQEQRIPRFVNVFYRHVEEEE